MKKLLSIIMIIFAVVSLSAQSVANRKVTYALSMFEHDYPEHAGKARLTGGNGERTWQRQMEFILERPDKYANISRRFTQTFNVQLPTAASTMTDEMLIWWEREIMAQAGKPNGFAHIGGKAQDISVRNLGLKEKLLLETYIKNQGMGIIYEIPPKEYYVSIDRATVFHCYLD